MVLQLCFFLFNAYASSNSFTHTYNYNFAQLDPWMSWMKNSTTAQGVEFTLPGTADVNHIDDIGTIYLLAHLPMQVKGAPGSLDLRNAQIDLKIKASNLNLHHGKLAWWVVSNLPVDKTNHVFTYQQSNWAFTAKTLNEKALPDNSWSNVSFTLNPSPEYWTYAGTNTSIKGSWGNRYVYYPIGKVLANVDATLHFVIIGAKKPPEGTIQIGNIRINTAKAPQLPDYAALKKLIKAKKWAEAAPGLRLWADSGNSYAAFKYANILQYGLAGKVDICAARAYYKAAEAEVLEASVELASQDIIAICSPRDYQSALKRLEKAGKYPRARYYRAMILLNKFPKEANRKTIIEDFKFAAKGGYVDAYGELGVLALEDGHKKEALHWFSLAQKNALSSDPRKNDLFGSSVKFLE